MSQLRRTLLVLGLIPLSLCLMGASLHPQSSYEPKHKTLTLKVLGKRMPINLENPGVKVGYYPDGTLRSLSYQLVNKHIFIDFHQLGISGVEQVAQIKRYNVADGGLYLDGTCQTFDINGHIVSESNWIQGQLDGEQRFYNRFHRVVEQRQYEQGFPVGKWTMYYDDGTKAAEMNFPEGISEWKEIMPSNARADTAYTLYSAPMHSSMLTKEIWYNQDGIKQQEREYRLFRRGPDIVIEATGVSRSFDHSGRITRETHISRRGSKTDVQNIYADDGVHQHTIVWINGGVFRDQKILFRRR